MSSQDLVVKSNALINAAYSLTLAEQQVILSAIAQVRRDEPVTDEKLYTVTADDLSDVSGFRAKHEYETLREVAEKLWHRTIRVFEKPNGAGKTKGRESWLRWVQRCDYLPDQGAVSIRFGKDILPYLTELKNRFTIYERHLVAQMRSRYGIRLFELLMEWHGESEQEIEIARLRQIWELEKKYTNIRDLKRRVIEPAVADINEHTDLQVSVSYRKRGRVVTWITFKFAPKLKKPKKAVTSKDARQASKQLTESQLRAMAKPGETWDELGRRLIASGYPPRHIWHLIRQMR